MKDFLLRLLLDEEGPTAVEYAVMLALIIMAAMGSIELVGSATSNSFDDSTTQMTNAFNN